MYTVQYGVHVSQVRTNASSRDDRQTPRGLSRERIIQTAIDLVAREGEDVLSMRRIAQELDVWPMSLYRYFQDKQALLDALAEAAASGITLPSATGSWRTQLQLLLRQTKTAFQQHPGGLHLRLSGPALPPAAARVTETATQILEAAGLDPVEATAAWQALVHYTAGAAILNAADQFEYGLDRFLDGLQLRITTSPTHQEQ